MHKDIKRFGMDGIFKDDSNILKLRDQYEALITTEMRDKGYVPVLGLGPFWTTSYDAEKERYEFIISMHGVHVGGRAQAWKIEGMTVEGNLMKRHTPPSKSSTSSKSAK